MTDSPMLRVPAHDLAEGVSLGHGGKVNCTATGAVLREGDTAVVEFTHSQRSGVWSRAGVFHPDAAPTGDPVCCRESDTPIETLYASGRLAVASDCATQEATVRLIDAEVVAYYAPDGG